MKPEAKHYAALDGIWKKSALGGFCAMYAGHQLTVKPYRRLNGKGFAWVARMDNSASTSHAKPHATVRAAKNEAIKMAEDAVSAA